MAIKHRMKAVEFVVPVCEEEGCSWEGNPTEFKKDAKTQVDYHEQTVHAPELTDPGK